MKNDPQATSRLEPNSGASRLEVLPALVVSHRPVRNRRLGPWLDAPAIPEGVAGLTPAQIREASRHLARLADLQVRSGGIHLTLVAVLWTTIVLIPFRRSEPWAWWAMWTYPAWALAVSVMFLFIELQPAQPTPLPAISGWLFFALTAVLVLATRRDFLYLSLIHI